VEIKTKIASVLPFLLGVFYTLYAYERIDAGNTLLFLASMLLFDMATTALNNYIDTKTNRKPLQFTKAAAKLILYVLLISAAAAGLALALRTGLVVLICGALCFAIGIFYTFGPAPISRMPLGEVFSGVFMGFFIPLLVVLINAPEHSLIYLSFNGAVIQIWLDAAGLAKLGVVTAPAVCGVANIMLANNICDVEADVRVDRFTLPFYIGGETSLRLFAALYYASFGAVVAAAAFRVLPPYVLAAFLVFPVVRKNITVFRKHPSKEKTFPLSVQNFVVMMLPLIILAAAAAALR